MGLDLARQRSRFPAISRIPLRWLGTARHHLTRRGARSASWPGPACRSWGGAGLAGERVGPGCSLAGPGGRAQSRATGRGHPARGGPAGHLVAAPVTPGRATDARVRPGPSGGAASASSGPGPASAAEPDRLPGSGELAEQCHRVPGDRTGQMATGPHPQTAAGQSREGHRSGTGPSATTATCRCKVTQADSGRPARAALRTRPGLGICPWPRPARAGA